MSLRASYTLFAPLYDAAVRRASRKLRADSLATLSVPRGAPVLIPGIGTGLDVPLLPRGPRYVGLDLTRAMLARVPRAGAGLTLVQGDAMRLPFRDASFDAVVLHLIVAVVPDPRRCLAEAARVTRPGGQLLVLDKFLRPGERAPVRRTLNALTRRLATRLDVVFESLLAEVGGLEIERDTPALAGGWIRSLVLRKLG
ncbi:MAG: methyltransferase domain-containing protein [Burkholderiales bacterium]|nr:methyltransferase domain-containing protein [Burkholderiales bacterium]